MAKQEATEPPMVLTVPQAARLVGLSTSGLYRVLASGKGPKIIRLAGARSTRIDREDLRAWALAGRRDFR